MLYFYCVNIQEYEAASCISDFNLNSITVLTHDPGLLSFLIFNQIQHINVWSFLSEDEIEFNFNESLRVSKSIFLPLAEHVSKETLHDLTLSANECILPFQAFLNSIIVVKRILEKLAPKTILLFDFNYHGITRNTPECNLDSIIKSIIVDPEFDINYKIISPSVNLEQPKKIRIKRFDVNKIYSLQKFFRFTPKYNFKCLIYETLLSKSQYDDLLSASNSSRDIKFFSLSLEYLKLMTGADYKDISTHNLYQLLFEKSIESKINTNFLSNKYIKTQINLIINEVFLAQRVSSTFENILLLHRPNCVIFGYDGFTVERLLIKVAKKHKIPTLCLLHGEIRYEFTNFDLCNESDCIVTRNLADFNYFNLNKKVNKYSEVKFWSQNIFNYHIDNQATLKSENSNRMNPRKFTILLITTKINHSIANPVCDVNSFINDMFKFFEKYGSHPNIDIIIKSHPGYDFFDLYEFLSRKYSNVFYDRGITLNDAIKNSSFGVMFNYASSSIVNCIVNRLPTVLLNSSSFNKINRATNFGVSALNTFDNIDDLFKKIDNGYFLEDFAETIEVYNFNWLNKFISFNSSYKNEIIQIVKRHSSFCKDKSSRVNFKSGNIFEYFYYIGSEDRPLLKDYVLFLRIVCFINELNSKAIFFLAAIILKNRTKFSLLSFGFLLFLFSLLLFLNF